MTHTKSEIVSLRLPPAIKARIDQLAAAQDRSRSWILLHLIQRALDATKKGTS